MRIIYWTFALVLFISCTNEEILQTEKTPFDETEVVVDQEYVQGFVRIMVTGELSDKMEATAVAGQSRTRAMEADDAIARVKVRAMKRTFPHAGRFEARSRKAGLHLWYDVEFDSEVSLEEAHANLQGIHGVRNVEY